MAIEFFESVDDKRHKDYQNRLSFMLSQPDILKKLNNSSHTNFGKIYLFIKMFFIISYLIKEQEESNNRQKMKISVDYKDLTNNQMSNEKKVKVLVDDINKMDGDNLKEVILNDIKKQGESFKERLMQRRKRNQDNKSRQCSRQCSPKREDREIENNLESVLSHDVVKNLNFDNLENHTEEVDSTISTHNTHLENDSINPLKPNLEKRIIIDSIEEADEKDVLEDENPTKPNYEPKLLSKHKNLFDEIDLNLENYNKEFNSYFYHSVFQRFSETIDRLMNEQFKKYAETCRIYQNQIKEMEFLMNDDDQHQESINSIIESLREEKQQELDRIEYHYQNLIDEAVSNFKMFGIKNNSGVQLIEEKLKLDMFNLVNNTILPGLK